MKAAGLLLCIMLATAPLHAQNTPADTTLTVSINWFEGSWNDVVAEAALMGRPIFVYVGSAASCAPCRVLEREILPDRRVVQHFDTMFVAYHFDGAGQQDLLRFRDLYRVSGTPSFLFFDSNGALLDRRLGLPTSGDDRVAEFVAWTRAALDPDKGYYTLKRHYELGNREPEFLYRHCRAAFHALTCVPYIDVELDSLLDEYLATQSDGDLLEPHNWALLVEQLEDVESPAFRLLYDNRQQLVARYGRSQVNLALLDIALRHAMQPHANDAQQAPAYAIFEAIKPMIDTEVDRAERVEYLQRYVEMYAEMDMWSEYARSAVEYVGLAGVENVSEMGMIVLRFADHIDDAAALEQMVAWNAERLEQRPTASGYSDHALMLSRMGAIRLAREAATRALELADEQKASRHVRSQIEYMLEQLRLRDVAATGGE